MCDQLTWSHYRTLLSVEKDEVEYYIKISLDYNLSVRELKHKIKNQEYKRIPKETKKIYILMKQIK